jgi:hypothetical protein
MASPSGSLAANRIEAVKLSPCVADKFETFTRGGESTGGVAMMFTVVVAGVLRLFAAPPSFRTQVAVRVGFAP